MPQPLPREGFQDLGRRLQIVRNALARFRVQRRLYKAETELGWLGWEQVEFYDEETIAHVEKIQEFENTQANLQNTTAEISGRTAALDENLDHIKKTHDETQNALSAERAPIAMRLREAEIARGRKRQALDRFDRAVQELDNRERRLEKESLEYMNLESPKIQERSAAREISDEIKRIGGERKLVMADKANAAVDIASRETEINHLRSELQRIDHAANDARDALAAAARRLGGEMRDLEREKEKTNVRMSSLDKEKRKPYQFIGACMADHGIAPRNQPHLLDNVFTLRDRQEVISARLDQLHAACGTSSPATLISFYLILLILLAGFAALTIHFL